ncbi:MAG: serine/threonine protein kinase [Planctomycetota bacterium]
MAERKIGPFIVGEQIGAGGMGVVYKATYVETGKEVALKILPPGLAGDEKLRKRFEREIDILKRLSHPNIVKYFGGGTQDGQRWYAMEFIDGGSLQDILRKKRRLGWEQAIQVGRQLCAALEVAHNAGIIHRDLKPANLFITKKGKLKLGDFGIARDTEATALTADGKTVGTYAYMAPEQIHGNVALSRKTDLYAAGCLLFEVLTGQTPFIGANPAEMLVQHLNDDPYTVREKGVECPAALDALIERMLSKNPDDRPYDALAVHTELTEILNQSKQGVSEATPQALMASGASQSATVDPQTGEVKPKKKKKKSKGAFYEQTWFLTTSLLLLVAFAFWLTMGPGEDGLYLQAKEAMTRSDAVSQHDAKNKFLLPYLEKYPDGKYAAEIKGWLDQVEVAVLEAQVDRKARGNRDGRNKFESACVAAVKAERDQDRNPLEAIELFQALINMTADAGASSTPATESPESPDSADVVGDPKYWRMMAEKHLNSLRTAFLAKDPQDRHRLLTERIAALEPSLADEKSSEGKTALTSFRDAFRGEKDMEPWLDYARDRIVGDQPRLPDPPQAVNADKKSTVP